MTLTPAAASAFINGDRANFLAAITPGGIERQEAQGQADLARAANRLPSQIIYPRNVTHADITREMGITFGAPVDELFVSVTLPAGWVIKPTEHSMHSDLVDDKGRVRAAIFYKAAFYDRNANLRLNTRYTTRAEYEEKTRSMQVLDTATGQVVKSFGPSPSTDFDAQDIDDEAAADWLAEHYPDHANPFAYWAD